MPNTTNTHLPTILYVEDNEGDALLLTEALRVKGHATQLLILEKGDKALRYLQVKASASDVPPPHCILLDGYLPVVTGIELLRFIRGSRSFDQTPVYIFNLQRNYSQLVTSGMVSEDTFLVKPNTWDGFLLLADHLMRSAEITMKHPEVVATKDNPEIKPPADLKM